jgi:hypothetical protein
VAVCLIHFRPLSPPPHAAPASSPSTPAPQVDSFADERALIALVARVAPSLSRNLKVIIQKTEARFQPRRTSLLGFPTVLDAIDVSDVSTRLPSHPLVSSGNQVTKLHLSLPASLTPFLLQNS